MAPHSPAEDSPTSVVFELKRGTSGWTESLLYAFTGGADGVNPQAPVIFDSAGNLYGTTSSGGICPAAEASAAVWFSSYRHRAAELGPRQYFTISPTIPTARLRWRD